MSRMIAPLIMVICAAAPAQEAVEKAYSEAFAALERLAAATKASKHGSHETIESMLADLARVGEGIARDNARRLAAKGPQVLLELKLFEHSAALAELGVDARGESDVMTPAVLDAAAARRIAKATRGSMISAPSLLSYSGDEVRVELGGVKTIDYLDREPDGRYALKKRDVKDALTFVITPIVEPRQGQPRVITVNCEMRISAIEGRTPVEKGAKQIGAPIVTSTKATTRVRVPHGGHVLVPIKGKDARNRWMLLHARTLGEGAPKQGR